MNTITGVSPVLSIQPAAGAVSSSASAAADVGPAAIVSLSAEAQRLLDSEEAQGAVAFEDTGTMKEASVAFEDTGTMKEASVAFEDTGTMKGVLAFEDTGTMKEASVAFEDSGTLRVDAAELASGEVIAVDFSAPKVASDGVSSIDQSGVVSFEDTGTMHRLAEATASDTGGLKNSSGQLAGMMQAMMMVK